MAKKQNLYKMTPALCRADDRAGAGSAIHRQRSFDRAARASDGADGQGKLTREKLRQLLLLMIERVDAPFTIEGVTVRTDRKTLRKLAKVKMRFPNSDGVEECLSPVYLDEFGGTRTFIPVKEGEEPDLKSLIVDGSTRNNVPDQKRLALDEDG